MNNLADHYAHSVLIKGFADYRVCPCGHVISLKRGKFRALAAFPRDRSGHHAVNLCVNGTVRTVAISRVVATAFLPPPQLGQNCVLHGDDDPANNAATNLSWGTNAKNSQDMVSRDRQSRGANRPLSKLTDAQVVDIRRLAITIPQNKLASQFGISCASLNSIVLGKTWRHVHVAE